VEEVRSGGALTEVIHKSGSSISALYQFIVGSSTTRNHLRRSACRMKGQLREFLASGPFLCLLQFLPSTNFEVLLFEKGR